MTASKDSLSQTLKTIAIHATTALKGDSVDCRRLLAEIEQLALHAQRENTEHSQVVCLAQRVTNWHQQASKLSANEQTSHYPGALVLLSDAQGLEHVSLSLRESRLFQAGVRSGTRHFAQLPFSLSSRLVPLTTN